MVPVHNARRGAPDDGTIINCFARSGSDADSVYLDELEHTV